MKYFKCACAHCGGRIEYPVEAVGTAVDCPHCGQMTDLVLLAPPDVSARSGKSVVWIGIGGVILLLGIVGVAGAFFMLNRVARHRPTHATAALTPTNSATNAFVTNELTVGAVDLQRLGTNSLIYATGVIKNEANRRRFGVKVDVELLDDEGAVLAKTSDYTQAIEPGGNWAFRALVLDKRATQARISAISEDN